MRARTLFYFLYSLVFFFCAPFLVFAATPPPFILDVGFLMPRNSNLGGAYQTALKANDRPILRSCVLNPQSIPVFTADLSQLGVSSSTIISSLSGPGHIFSGNIDYFPAYCANISMVIGADIPDGLKDISLSITGSPGGVSTTTIQVAVDNVTPTISLSGIDFSATPPKKGDLMYLSGSSNGTGSALSIYEIRETLWKANGSPVWPSGSGVNYNKNILTAAIATSTDGSFTRVPFVLNEGTIGETAAAASLKIVITAYDGVGNTVTTSLTVPVPQPPPPDPCIAAGNCVSNVLFLPGIESSRLYRPDYNGGADELWEPNIDSDVKDLYMNADGTSTRFDVYAKERDVIDELPNGANIYKSFIAKMDGLKTSGTITDWEPIAYDWRLSLDDILAYGNNVQGRIYYSGDLRATSTPYITQELKRLATTSKTGKVTIVAHSNGGLLAKRLTELLGATESARLIDKMIFVAVPQAGTPAAVAAGLHGYGQDKVLGLIISKNSARTLANDAPMEYQLLPSAQYFTYVDDPVITFDTALTDWVARYGESIHSQERLKAFLTDSFGRVDPQTGDSNQPIQANSTLLSSAETLHTSLDSWTPPAGVPLTQIAGWGVPKTVEGITYKKKGAGVTPEANLTIDGDGTVVAPSAFWVSTTTGATNYWMNLGTYNERHPFQSGLGFTIFDHSRILETDTILDFISDQIASTTKPLSDYTYLSTEAPASSGKRLRYALHSPLTLNLYDAEGRHTGVSTSTGQVEEQIPGTYYTEFGEVKYLFSDAATNASLIMNGYDTGTFTLNVDEYSGDTLTESTTFEDVPTTASTVASLTVQSDSSTLSSMVVDESGDGSNVITLVPIVGETVTYEPPAPTPAPAPASAPQSAGSISIPIIIPGAGAGAVAEVASTTVVLAQPVAISNLKAVTPPKPVLVKSKAKKKPPVVALAPIKKTEIKKVEKKVSTNVAQTASVASAVSQQSGFRSVGAAVYNGWQGFLSALKKIF